MCIDKIHGEFLPKIERLGITGYRDVWALQRQRRDAVAAGSAPEVIYFTQHRSVYTLGRHGHAENMLMLPSGVECVRIERGGDITYHAPGQIVVYPIISLWNRRLGVKDYVHALEQWIIDTIASYGITGSRSEGAPGVWLEVGTPRERKIAALGVKVGRGVTMHGFALNADIDLRGFSNINPCGFVDRGVTSIARETGCFYIDVDDLQDRLTACIPPELKITK